MLVKFVHQKQS